MSGVTEILLKIFTALLSVISDDVMDSPAREASSSESELLSNAELLRAQEVIKESRQEEAQQTAEL